MRRTNKIRDKEVVNKYDKREWSFERIAEHYNWKSHQAAMKAYYRAKNNNYPHIRPHSPLTTSKKI